MRLFPTGNSISFFSDRCRIFLSLPTFGSLRSSVAMSGVKSVAAISNEDDVKYGFQRPEMYSSKLAGTVGTYGRHVFVCYKSPDAWASRVETDALPKALGSALKERGGDISVKTLLTVCDGGDSDGDVLVFPEMIRYKSLETSHANMFVEDVIVNGKPWASGTQELLVGSYIFVCAHGSRDKRCGVCGPVLIEKLKHEIELRGLSEKVFVKPCSHIGGHKYAGNLIIYSPDSNGKIKGHWYGYVTPGDVPELLDQHVAKGNIIERLWRGQMGLPPDDDSKVHQKTRLDVPDSQEIEQQERKSQVESVGCGCYRGATCCRVETSEGTRAASSSWTEPPGKREIIAATAVIGALATVGYSLFRRSR